MSDEKLPKSVHNWVSLAGAVVAVVSGAIILFLLAINFLESITNPYLGILLYLVLPLALAAGLLMITLGMYARWRSLQKRGEVVRLKWPSIDLNKPRHRNASLVFLLGTLAFVLMSTVGIYQAYQFSDSVTFCGTTCHTIMKPEYTTYQHSPHARVKCVACHIGPGAGWYVRSKLSGLYQVYATIANIYPRPLPNPIKHLRPLQRECLSCHWPSKFFGTMERHFDHYLYDKSNTPWSIVMLLRVGGGGPSVGRRQGIHWHTSPEIRVEYIATDRLRQNIPWVRVTDLRTGKSIVYREAGAKPSTEVAWAQAGRVMDCIDCHNHPRPRRPRAASKTTSRASTGKTTRSSPRSTIPS
ncbi:MAG: NapC/NirT family cytochrome c [Nitrospirota bacterium]